MINKHCSTNTSKFYFIQMCQCKITYQVPKKFNVRILAPTANGTDSLRGQVSWSWPNEVETKFSWFGWPDCPGNVRAQFVGRRGKVLHWLFSIVGMAYQSQNVNRAIPDDRVARSPKSQVLKTRSWQLAIYCKTTNNHAYTSETNKICHAIVSFMIITRMLLFFYVNTADVPNTQTHIINSPRNAKQNGGLVYIWIWHHAQVNVRYLQ